MGKILQKFSKVVAAGVVVALTLGFNATVASASTNDSALSKYQIFTKTNQERAKAGKQQLQASIHLDKVAQYWANELAKPGAKWQHNPNLNAMVQKTSGWQTWGENIAAGYADGNKAMTGWMNSSGHKANILNGNYDRIGIGIAYGGEYGVYYVQVFGKNAKDQTGNLYPNPVNNKPATTKLTRLAGADRYSTNNALVSNKFKSKTPVVYVASGANFPDALVASSAAATEGGPIILAPANVKQISSTTKNQLRTMNPDKIVVVGGTGVVSNAVVNELKKSAPNAKVTRLGGNDRYETGRLINNHVWSSGVDKLYVATGRDFPDALAASSAAGSQRNPITLVDGKKNSLDSSSKNHIAKLAPKEIVIVGGTGVVSSGVMNDLKKIAPTVRLSGADRYATAHAINSKMLPNASKAYWVSGSNFPDALSASVNAALDNAPLYLVQKNCAPTTAVNVGKKAADVILVGGTGVISPAVERFTTC